MSSCFRCCFYAWICEPTTLDRSNAEPTQFHRWIGKSPVFQGLDSLIGSRDSCADMAKMWQIESYNAKSLPESTPAVEGYESHRYAVYEMGNAKTLHIVLHAYWHWRTSIATVIVPAWYC